MLNECETEQLGYRFKDTGLLCQALTHPSYANHQPHNKPQSNEALESLGDMVLKVLQTMDICKQRPGSNKATITEIRQRIETNAILYQHVVSLGLYEKVRVDNTIKHDATKYKKAFSKVLEAVIGAIYIDSGYNWNLLEQWYYHKISTKL